MLLIDYYLLYLGKKYTYRKNCFVRLSAVIALIIFLIKPPI